MKKLLFFLCAIALPAFAFDNRFKEVWFTYTIKNLIPKDAVIILAGGYTSETVKDLVHTWPEGKLFVFEPNPTLFEKIAKMCMWYPIQVFPYALDQTSGFAPFYLTNNPRNPRIGSLLPSQEEWKWYYKDTKVIPVACKNLEEWARENHVTHIDFLQLNVGGNELRVLKSIPSLLRTIKVILVETHFQEFRQGIGLFSDVEDFLNRNNFEIVEHIFVPNYQGYAIFAKKDK